ncbi:MAG: hypothetical protein P1V97_29920, partial [Planctomycetota bacterium]|nr:hypothetical protein [Planctomycetota bacterium]
FYEVATETLRHCLTLDSDQTEALKSLAGLLEKQELNDEAVAVYEDLLKQSEGKVDSAELLQIWSEIGRLKPEDCAIRRTLADLYLEAKDRTQAFMELQELATLYLTDDKLDEAIPVLREAHELDKDEIMVHESLATTLARLGRSDEAITEFLALARNLERADDGGIFRQHLITIYNKIIDLSPDHGEARAWLAKAYEDKKESDKAAANYKGMLPALRAGDDDEKLLEVLGKVYSLEPSDEEIAHEYADLLAEHNQSVEGIRILSKIAEAALTEGDQDKAADVYSALLDLAPGHFIAHRTLARSEVAADDKDQALKRYRGMAILFEANGHLEDAEESWRKALDIRANDPRIHAEYADCLTFCNKPKTAVKHWFKAAKLYRDEENKGLAKSCIGQILELDSEHEEAKKLLKSLESKPAPSATIEMDQPAVPEKPQPKEKAMPTITGGGRASVQVLGGTRRLSSVNKLKSMLFSKGFASNGPEGPGSVASEQVSKKAKSGINKLKAMRGGASSDSGGSGGPKKAISEGPEGDYKPLDEKVSKKAKGGINKLKAMRGGSGASGGPKKAVSEGPEGDYKPVDAAVSSKAKSGINKLKALRGGGGSAGGAKPKGAVSEGPEGDYKPVDEKVSNKAKSGINRLKALRGGGSSGGASPKGAVSEGPEGDYKPLDEKVSQKAKSGINKLKALKGTGAGPLSGGPEQPFKPVSEGASNKAKSGINKLKAMRGGASSGGISAGPEGEYKPVDEKVSSKAKSGINKLKALRGGGGAAGGAKPKGAVSEGPEGDYKPLDTKVSNKAKSGINKLKALRGGGGFGGGTASNDGAKPKGAVSEGPEGEYKPVDAAVSSKAKSGINKLKALRGGGGSAGGAKPKGAVSEGPEGDYKPVDAAVSNKAKSGINKLKALRGGGASSGSGAKPKGAISEGPEGDYKPVDEKVSQKAKSGINKLKALKKGSFQQSET